MKVATAMDNTKLALRVGEWRKSTYQIWLLHYRVIIFEMKKRRFFLVTYHRRRRLADTMRVAAAASAPKTAPAAMAAVLPGTRHRQSLWSEMATKTCAYIRSTCHFMMYLTTTYLKIHSVETRVTDRLKEKWKLYTCIPNFHLSWGLARSTIWYQKRVFYNY